MSQLLRLLVNERLAAAAEEIFGLVEKTIAAYEDEAVRSKGEINQLKKQIEQLTVLQSEVIRADVQSVSEELLPSEQQCDIKMEEFPVLEETEIQEHPQVKEEQVDQCISPDMEADPSYDAEVRHLESEPITNCEMFPSPSAVTASVNKSIDAKWTEGDGSSPPRQSHSVEVVVGVEQPPSEDKSCCFCGKIFKRDSNLIRHVDKLCKVRRGFKFKSFRCLTCGKTFHTDSDLKVHMEVHESWKRYISEKLQRQECEEKT